MKVSLKALVTGIGAVVAIVTAVSLPAAYFAAGYANLSQRLAFEAGLNCSAKRMRLTRTSGSA